MLRSNLALLQIPSGTEVFADVLKETTMFQKIMRNAVLGLAVLFPLDAFAATHNGHAGQQGGNQGGNQGRNVSRQSAIVTTRRVVQSDIRRLPADRFVRRESHERSSLGAGRRDRDGDRGHHFSHRRHHWHNRWWTYGIGPCWAYSDRYDEYYWTCGDDD